MRRKAFFAFVEKKALSVAASAAVALSLTGSLLSSCTQFDFHSAYENYTEQQKAFISSFTDMYGALPDKHSWTSLSTGSIKLSFSEFAEGSKLAVGLYTADPRFTTTPCYLIAENEGVIVNASYSLRYQYPTGLDYIYIAAYPSGEKEESPFFVGRVATGDGVERRFPADSMMISVLPEHPAMRYILAFETMEQEGRETVIDYDYNDCVVGVDYVQGRDSATVQMLAAGTTNGIRLTYMRGNSLGNPQDEILFDEAHNALGLAGYPYSMTKKYIYDPIGTGTYKATSQPTVSVSLVTDDYLPTHVLRRISALVGDEKQDDSKKERLRLQTDEGYRLGQVLCVPDGTWQWPTEGDTIHYAYRQFLPWLLSAQANPFWYSGVWKFANMTEQQSNGNLDDVRGYGYKLELDESGTYISSDQLEPYRYYPSTLTLHVTDVEEGGGRIQLMKYPNRSVYYYHEETVDEWSFITVPLSLQNIANICDTASSRLSVTGLQITTVGCQVSAVYIQ